MAAAVAVALVALVVAGCGSSGNDNVKASAAGGQREGPTPDGGSARRVDVRTAVSGSSWSTTQGRTLYLFEKDTGTKSTCSGACATRGRPPQRAAGPRRART